LAHLLDQGAKLFRLALGLAQRNIRRDGLHRRDKGLEVETVSVLRKPSEYMAERVAVRLDDTGS
jgi:hypothetical protein